jgi:hypothetical protein
MGKAGKKIIIKADGAGNCEAIKFFNIRWQGKRLYAAD